ncbi:hypothetical protein MIND_01016500 [Mycena indigotica]|uniref:Epidermal growth factor receptor-like transmembrane-juxtamembrane segment domain-containing protein n=1 Tax=Mycena indigotica TaxID=2126181 RepID=A0A8H6S9G6_9AGAR|nr:uncharacterized protein MIND_01016500 [Mycena indigotica]KAF7294788.1 hypothetical protein MIND_01016500 [Mycena indigotica]
MRLKVAILVSVVALVAAQSSDVATCTPAYGWSINARGQTPCLVAAYAEQACESSFVEVNQLPANTHYIGPSKANANLCRCSTVTYSLVSACAGCQDRQYISWTEWATNCTKVEVAQYLQTVSAAVVVPPWAYLDVTLSNNAFSPTLASANATAASTPSPSPAPTTTSASIATIPSNPVALPSVASSSSPKKGSNAGAIAGGVVGGLAVIVIAVFLVLFCLRRKKQPEAMYPPNTASSFSATSHVQPLQHQLTGSSGRPTSPGSPLFITPFPYHQQDRSDAETTYHGSPSFDSPSITPAVQIVRRYNGAAEV